MVVLTNPPVPGVLLKDDSVLVGLTEPTRIRRLMAVAVRPLVLAPLSNAFASLPPAQTMKAPLLAA